MADWSGEVYVYEGNGRLFHGTTKVRQDGVQEPLGAKRRVVQRAATYSADTGCTWWQDLRRQSSTGMDEKGVVDAGNGPPKLFKIALSYVASHISNVDSFDGFPDGVGRQLFEEAYRLGRFRNPEDCVEPFRLFSDAYGAVFASNLSLSKVVISSCICLIITKSCASVLGALHLKDVTFESPGIRQSLLQGIGQMPRIRKLSLVGCDLKDADVRLLTARARLYRTNADALVGLEEFDLSDNYNVSGMSVRYLSVMENLRLLTMSGTSIESNDGLHRLESLGLELASTEQVSRLLSIQKGRYSETFASNSTATQASSFAPLPWADRAFADWQKTSPRDQRTAKNENEATKFKFSTFYNPSKERAKEARVKNSHAVPLVFVRRKRVGPVQVAPTPSSENWRRGKRKRSEWLAAESVLHQIFDENRANSAEKTSDFDDAPPSTRDSREKDEDLTSQYADSSSREAKRAKKTRNSSVFDFI